MQWNAQEATAGCPGLALGTDSLAVLLACTSFLLQLYLSYLRTGAKPSICGPALSQLLERRTDL